MFYIFNGFNYKRFKPDKKRKLYDEKKIIRILKKYVHKELLLEFLQFLSVESPHT